MANNVSTPCKEYNQNIEKWKKCRDTVAGEERIKKQSTLYLPRLDAQSQTDYEGYKNRAMFYGATSRTVDGLLGGLFRKAPVILPDNTRVKSEMESVTQGYQSAVDFSGSVSKELLVTGRVGVLVDAPMEVGGIPYLETYTAENIINWRYSRTKDGVFLTLVVLRESYGMIEEDNFALIEKTQYRVLEITEAGTYQQRVFRESKTHDGGDGGFIEQVDLTVTPSLSGTPFNYIPFVFFSSVDLTADVMDSPILALANVNLSHYRSSADLEHGRHFTGLPTAWVAGFDTDTELKIGSQVAWVSENPDAHAGYLEFTGQGLGSLENALKEKQEMMAVLGARMLEDPKRVAESGSALSTRYRGENNVLSNIAKTVSRGLSQAFSWLMEWRGAIHEIEIQLNTDFINDKITPKDVVDLMGAWQSGAISWDTLYYNYKRGELYPDGVDQDTEKAALDYETNMDSASF